MRHFISLLTAVLLFVNTNAQTTEDSVKATVNHLFKAMQDADADKLLSVFADSAVLETIVTTRDGQVKVHRESTAAFADFLRKEEPGNADEQIRFEAVHIDGNLAMVWTPYSFFYKKKFSHCGVNAFTLVRTGNEWKIRYIIDTRRKDPCNH
ncbi:nuclear transport factor 2 family protein [Nostoc ellipsosporum NOK]|nr:nuclear transport factor 2 family protein [Nostoc ellipsosporum NOK]